MNIFEKFIYQKPNSISPELCNTIIEYFEKEEKKYKGITANGLNVEVKDTTDFFIPPESFFCGENEQNTECSEDSTISKWSPICKILNEQLQENINNYMRELKNNPQFSSDNYRLLNVNYLTEDTYQIQKYVKGEGKYVYHNDFCVDWNRKQYRVITFLWYLNTIVEGGETELLGEILVKPEAGKLLLFPACWTFPHRGKMPISDNKYIVTGWFYINENE
jgi:hypothetical protein